MDSIVLEATVRSVHAASALFSTLPPGDEALVTAVLAGKAAETRPLPLSRGAPALIWRSGGTLSWTFSAREWAKLRSTTPTLKLQLLVQRTSGAAGGGAHAPRSLRFPAGFALVDLRGSDFAPPQLSAAFQRALPMHATTGSPSALGGGGGAGSGGVSGGLTTGGGVALNVDFTLFSGHGLAVRSLHQLPQQQQHPKLHPQLQLQHGPRERVAEAAEADAEEAEAAAAAGSPVHPRARGAATAEAGSYSAAASAVGRPSAGPASSQAGAEPRQDAADAEGAEGGGEGGGEGGDVGGDVDAIELGPGPPTQRYSLEITLAGLRLAPAAPADGGESAAAGGGGGDRSGAASSRASSAGYAVGAGSAPAAASAPLWLSYKLFGVLVQTDTFSFTIPSHVPGGPGFSNSSGSGVSGSHSSQGTATTTTSKGFDDASAPGFAAAGGDASGVLHGSSHPPSWRQQQQQEQEQPLFPPVTDAFALASSPGGLLEWAVGAQGAGGPQGAGGGSLPVLLCAEGAALAVAQLPLSALALPLREHLQQAAAFAAGRTHARAGGPAGPSPLYLAGPIAYEVEAPLARLPLRPSSSAGASLRSGAGGASGGGGSYGGYGSGAASVASSAGGLSETFSVPLARGGADASAPLGAAVDPFHSAAAADATGGAGFSSHAGMSAGLTGTLLARVELRPLERLPVHPSHAQALARDAAAGRWGWPESGEASGPYEDDSGARRGELRDGGRRGDGAYSAPAPAVDGGEGEAGDAEGGVDTTEASLISGGHADTEGGAGGPLPDASLVLSPVTLALQQLSVVLAVPRAGVGQGGVSAGADTAAPHNEEEAEEGAAEEEEELAASPVSPRSGGDVSSSAASCVAAIRAAAALLARRDRRAVSTPPTAAEAGVMAATARSTAADVTDELAGTTATLPAALPDLLFRLSLTLRYRGRVPARRIARLLGLGGLAGAGARAGAHAGRGTGRGREGSDGEGSADGWGSEGEDEGEEGDEGEDGEEVEEQTLSQVFEVPPSMLTTSCVPVTSSAMSSTAAGDGASSPAAAAGVAPRDSSEPVYVLRLTTVPRLHEAGWASGADGQATHAPAHGSSSEASAAASASNAAARAAGAVARTEDGSQAPAGGGRLVLHLPTGCRAPRIAGSHRHGAGSGLAAPLQPFGRVTLTAALQVSVPGYLLTEAASAVEGAVAGGAAGEAARLQTASAPGGAIADGSDIGSSGGGGALSPSPLQQRRLLATLPLGSCTLAAADVYALSLSGGGRLQLQLRPAGGAGRSGLQSLLAAAPALSLGVLPHPSYRPQVAAGKRRAAVAAPQAALPAPLPVSPPPLPRALPPAAATAQVAALSPATAPAAAYGDYDMGEGDEDDSVVRSWRISVDVRAVRALRLPDTYAAAAAAGAGGAAGGSSGAEYARGSGAGAGGGYTSHVPPAGAPRGGAAASSVRTSFTPLQVRFGLAALGAAVALERMACEGSREASGGGGSEEAGTSDPDAAAPSAAPSAAAAAGGGAVLLHPHFPRVPSVLSLPPVLLNPATERALPHAALAVSLRLSRRNLRAGLAAAPLVIDLLSPQPGEQAAQGQGQQSGGQSPLLSPASAASSASSISPAAAAAGLLPLPGVACLGSAIVDQLAGLLLDDGNETGSDTAGAAGGRAGSGLAATGAAAAALQAAARTLWRCPLSGRHFSTRQACARSIAAARYEAGGAVGAAGVGGGVGRAGGDGRRGTATTAALQLQQQQPIRVRAFDAWLHVLPTAGPAAATAAGASMATAGVSPIASLRVVVFAEDFGPAVPLASASAAASRGAPSSQYYTGGAAGSSSETSHLSLLHAPAISVTAVRAALLSQRRREEAALRSAAEGRAGGGAWARGDSGVGVDSSDAAWRSSDAAASGTAVDLGGVGAPGLPTAGGAVGLTSAGSGAVGREREGAAAEGAEYSQADTGRGEGRGWPPHPYATPAAAAPAAADPGTLRAALDPLLSAIAGREEAAWAAWRSEAEGAWAAAKAAAEAEWRASSEAAYAARAAALEAAWAEREAERQTAVATAQEGLARVEAKLRRLLASAEAKEREAERALEAARGAGEARTLELNSLARRLREDAEHAGALAKQREAAAAARVAEAERELAAVKEAAARSRAEADAATSALARGPDAGLRDALAALQAEAAAQARAAAEARADSAGERRAKEEARVQVLRLAREVARLREEARAREAAEAGRLRVAYLAAEERYVLEGDRAVLRGIRRQVDALGAGASAGAGAGAAAGLGGASVHGRVEGGAVDGGASRAGLAAPAPAPLLQRPYAQTANAGTAATPSAFAHASTRDSTMPRSVAAPLAAEIDRLRRERRALTSSGSGGYTASHPLVLAIDRQIMALREQLQQQQQEQEGAQQAATSGAAVDADSTAGGGVGSGVGGAPFASALHAAPEGRWQEVRAEA